MIIEILQRLVAVYQRWHAKHALLSGMILTVMAIFMIQVAWSVLWWITAFASPARQRHAIAGRVTWQGRPLESGLISFRPLEGQPYESGASVTAGEFSIPSKQGLAPGVYLVRIHASQADPSRPAPAKGERDTRPGIEILPPKYNTSSSLKATISSWGRSRLTFDLAP